MKIQSSALVTAMAFSLISGACSSKTTDSSASGGNSNSGGNVATGGSSNGGGDVGTGGSSNIAGGVGTGGGASCSNVTACGGNVVGSWSVASACLKTGGQADLKSLGIGCTTAPITGSRQVTGKFTANADGTYLDETMTTGQEQITLAPACLMISGTTTNCASISGPLAALGYSTVTCTANAAGGCDCAGTVQQSGSIGLPNSGAQTSGNYVTSGNELTADDTTKYSYCVAGNQLTITPESPTTTGSIALQKGDLGTGGAGGGGAGGAGAGGSGTGGAAGSVGTAGSGGSGGSTAPSDRPCDIYAAATTPCVAAYSMIRSLSKAYTGPLYQVRNGSSAMNTGTGGMTKDIGMTADGYADTAAQDTFCAGTICTVSVLYDQSGKKNDLKVAPKGNTAGGATGGEADYESSATKGSLTVNGHKVYPLYMAAHEGYRLNVKGAGVPVGAASEGIYELADGTHSGGACCWDFGNVTTDPLAYHTMNTVFFGQAYWGNGAGSAPWFMADFEAGVWAGGSKVGDPGWGALNDPHPSNPNDPSMAGVKFALGILKTSSAKYAIRAANAQTAADLTTAFEGPLPKTLDNQGGIVLGVGGDNSNYSWGTFYEGAIVAGYPSNDTDLAIMKNIHAAGYPTK